jgi:hypothetical protein
MTIESAEHTLERRRLVKKLEASAQDIAPDTKDNSPAEAIVENRNIVLMSADMHIPVMHEHRQNVIRAGTHTQTSQTLWSPSPVFLSTSRCSQLKLACQPLPGAGMNTRSSEGLDDLLVGITRRFREAMSSQTQHRKSKTRSSVTASVDNNCCGSLPALDPNCLCVVDTPSVLANASLQMQVYPARH